MDGGTPPDVADLVDIGAQLGVPSETSPDRAAEVIDGLGILDDPAVGPRQPVSMFPGLQDFDPDLDGYLLIGSETAVDGAYLPQNFDNDGVDVIGIRQEMPFAPPLTGGRCGERAANQTFRNRCSSRPAARSAGRTYNGSFPGDIFNNANLVIVSRDDNGSRSEETLAFQDGFWSPIEQIGSSACEGTPHCSGSRP